MGKKKGAETTLPGIPAPSAAPELKPLTGKGVGRTKGGIKKEAIVAIIPMGLAAPQEQIEMNIEQLVEKANEIALAKGYKPEITSEDFSEKKSAKPRVTKTQVSTAPTLDEARTIKAMLKTEGVDIEETRELIEKLKSLANAAGGMAKLEAVLTFLAE